MKKIFLIILFILFNCSINSSVENLEDQIYYVQDYKIDHKGQLEDSVLVYSGLANKNYILTDLWGKNLYGYYWEWFRIDFYVNGIKVIQTHNLERADTVKFVYQNLNVHITEGDLIEIVHITRLNLQSIYKSEITLYGDIRKYGYH